ncbi:hypothetical protein DRQ21_00015 [Candidatus Fermentibacteria bacterium]|nr:MAG: hypothetical protein DRQ21_00015 [Candidatus Fermentibacteria bacterium]
MFAKVRIQRSWAVFVKSNLTWLIFILIAGLVSRVPHLLSFLSLSTETALTYFPTLASARFEQCAVALIDGTQSGDAFSYASPLYILFLVPLYAVGITNTVVFLLQSITGIVSAILVFITARQLKASKAVAFSGAILWLFYAPAAFYEMTLLPVAILSLLVSVWGLQELNNDKTNTMSFMQGVVSGLIAGLRPPFVILGVFSIVRSAGQKSFASSLFKLLGLLLPLLILCFYHSYQGGGFTPFASSAGLNLVLGHAEGASGYGPPIAEYGLIENPSEDIHQVAARIAAENGANTPSEINSFWMEKAVNWILSNPESELEMLGIKLGAFFGYKPYDTYFDLDRDIENDRSLKLLFVPRYILIAFISAGLISFLMFDKKNRFLALPVIIALAASLGFVHSERYQLPSVPVTLAISSYGIQLLFYNLKTADRKRAIASILIAIVLMIPGRLWQVPEIPQGQYLYNRAAKAYNMRNYLLALTLFEESIETSLPGSTTAIYARMEALRISQALNLEDRVTLHTELLRMELDRVPDSP